MTGDATIPSDPAAAPVDMEAIRLAEQARCEAMFAQLVGRRMAETLAALPPSFSPLLGKVGVLRWHSLTADLKGKDASEDDWHRVGRLLKASQWLFEQACADGLVLKRHTNQNLFDIRDYHPEHASPEANQLRKQRLALWEQVQPAMAQVVVGLVDGQAAEKRGLARVSEAVVPAVTGTPLEAFNALHTQLKAMDAALQQGVWNDAKTGMRAALPHAFAADRSIVSKTLKQACDGWCEAMRQGQAQYGGSLTKEGNLAIEVAVATAQLASEQLQRMALQKGRGAGAGRG